MKQKNIDSVEIVEPPIEELTKTHGGFKRACFTSCVSIVLFVALVIVGTRLFLGSGPQTYKTIPDSLPSSVPMYAKDNIENITFIPGRYKSRGVKIATFIPRVILSPLVTSFSSTTPETTSASNVAKSGFFSSLLNIISSPPLDKRDTIQIQWNNIDAEPRFVTNYYKTELRKNGYTIDNETSINKINQFTFKNSAGVNGALYAADTNDTKSGTDVAILTVNLPLPPTTQ